MLKRLVSILITLSILIIPLVSYAAPDVIESDAEGTAEDLIELNNEEEEKVTIHEKYLITGTGEENIIVTLYILDPINNQYVKATITDTLVEENLLEEQADDMSEGNSNNEEVDYEENVTDDINTEESEQIDDEDIFTEEESVINVEVEVTAFGFMLPDIELEEGLNKLLLYAEKDEEVYQIIKIDVTLLKKEFTESAQSSSIDFGAVEKLIDDGDR